jgi:5,10-methylenetetrahydromethanopterin reductase
MRLGLLLSGARPVPEIVALARAAERAGVSDLWVSEDYFERGAFTLAAAVAAATSQAAVGIGVINPWTRHPMLTAMEFVALDEMSGGRAILGLGASNPTWMRDRAGIAYERPLTAVEEALTVIRAALRGEQVRFHGRFFEVDARLSFPAPRPDAPIHLGAKGRRALDLAARAADGVLLSLLSAPAYVTWAGERLGGSADLAAYVLASCGPDRMAARAAVRRDLAFYLGVHGDHDITRLAGLDAEIAGRFRDGWLAGRPAEELVTDDLIDTFTAAGDLADCRASLDRMAAAGLRAAVLRDLGDAAVDGLLELADSYRGTIERDRS